MLLFLLSYVLPLKLIQGHPILSTPSCINADHVPYNLSSQSQILHIQKPRPSPTQPTRPAVNYLLINIGIHFAVYIEGCAECLL